MSDTLSISVVPGALPPDGQQITNAILRAIARPTVLLIGTVGTAAVSDGAVTTAKLADGALSADATGRAKMADGFITTAKIAANGIETANIKDKQVTAAKLSDLARNGWHTYGLGIFSTGLYTVTMNAALSGYDAGTTIHFIPDQANDAGLAVNVDGLGTVGLVSCHGHTLMPGQIKALDLVTAVYNALAGVFVTNLPSRFETAAASAVTLPAASGLLTFAHGLGADPFHFDAYLYCVTNDTASAYVVGDKIPVRQATATSSVPMFLVTADATNVYVRRSSTATFNIPKKDTGATVAPTSGANFKLIVRAEL